MDALTLASTPPRSRKRARDYALAAAIGERLKARRESLGLTHRDLGQAVDLTYQQIQKYERGLDRVAAETLAKLAGVLQVPVAWFFESNPSPAPECAAEITLAAARAFRALPAPQRVAVLELMRGLGRAHRGEAA